MQILQKYQTLRNFGHFKRNNSYKMLLEKLLQTPKVNIWRNLTQIRRLSNRNVETDDTTNDEQWSYESADEDGQVTPHETQKVIRVAMIGVPNVGKSTLINELVDHRVCPVSSKVHTTRNFSRAITNYKNTQIIFYDTPGLITEREKKKHHLESTFLSAYRHSIQHSDLIGVVHDVSNSWTRNTLHKTIIEALQEYKTMPSILILNKIDTLKSKRVLLDLTRTLTRGMINGKPFGTRPRKSSVELPPPELVVDEKGTWPNFNQIFMISALSGDGVYKLMNHIIKQAKPGQWLFEPETFTDMKPEDLIVQTVKARLLDFLPQEIPYQLKCDIEFYSEEKKEIYASVLVTCPSQRIERLLCGVNNGKLRQISECCTSDLIESFQAPVSLTISTVSHGSS